MVYSGVDDLTPVQKQILAAQAQINAEMDRAAGLSNAHASAANNLSSSLNTLSASGQNTNKTFTDMARGAASSVFGFSLLAGGAVVAGREIAQFAQDAIQQSRQLEQEIANISSIKPSIDTTLLYAQLAEMQTRIPATAHQLADSYYQIASSIDVSATDTLAITEKTALGARAALAGVQQWSTGVVGALNAYKMGLADVDHIQDVFFLTVKNGVITGQQLASSFGPVAQGAQAAGQSFEFAAAASAAITKEGGNAADNMTRLKDLFEHFTSKKAQNELHAFGIATTDVKGNFLSFIDILGQLNTKLSTLSESGRAEVLQKIFPDVRARQGLDILLREIPNLTEYLKQNETQAGATGAAVGKMLDTTAAKAELVNNKIAQVKENLGLWLDPIRDIVTLSNSDFGKGINDFMNNLAKNGGPATEGIQALGSVFVSTSNDIDAASKKTLDSFAAMDSGIAAHDREMAASTSEAALAMTTDMDAYQKFLDSMLPAAQQALIKHQQAYTDLKTSLENDLTAVEAKISEYQSNTTSSSSAVANNYAWLVQQLQSRAGEIAAAIQLLIDAEHRLQEAALATQLGISQPVGPLSPSQGGGGSPQANAAVTADANAAGSARIAEASGKTKDLAKAHLDAAAAVVAHDQAAVAFNQGLDKLSGTHARSAQTIAAENQLYKDQQIQLAANTQYIQANTQATIDANAAREGRKGESAAKKADAAADSSRISSQYIEEIRARQAVMAAQKNLNDVTDAWNAKIDDATSNFKNYSDAAKASLAQFKSEITAAKDALDRYTQDANDRLKVMQDRIDADTLALKNLKQAQADALDPLKINALAAADALAHLRELTAAGDEQFARTAHQLALALYDLQQKEDAVAKPFDDSLKAQTLALQALRDEATKIAFVYDAQLIPLQAELNRLNEQAKASDHAKTLHDEALTVENLAARLATATGAEREHLQALYDQAKAKEELDTKRFSLEERIAAIEAEKKAALDAVNTRIKAAEMEKTATEEARAAAIKTYEEQKKIIEDSQKLLDHQREQFDYVQHQKELAAQADLDAVNKAIANQEAINRVVDDALQRFINDETTRRANYAKDASDYEAAATRKIAADQKTYDAIVVGISKTTAVLQGQIDTLKSAAKAAEDDAKDKVTYWQGIATTISQAYGVIDKLATAQDKGVTLTKDQASALKQSQDAINGIVKILPDMGNLYGGLDTTFKNTNTSISTKVSDLWAEHQVGGIPYTFGTAQNALDTMMTNKLKWTKDNVWGAAFDALAPLATTKLGDVKDASLAGALAVGTSIGDAVGDGFWAARDYMASQMAAAVNYALDGAKIGGSTPGSPPTGVPPGSPGNPPGSNTYGPPVSYAPPISSMTGTTVVVESHVHVHGSGLPKEQGTWDTVAREISRSLSRYGKGF